MQPPYPGHHLKYVAWTTARRSSHPHTVRQPGLLRSLMDDDQFLKQLDERRQWLAENCRGSFWVDELRESGVEVGKLYRFAELRDADWFRYRF